MAVRWYGSEAMLVAAASAEGLCLEGGYVLLLLLFFPEVIQCACHFRCVVQLAGKEALHKRQVADEVSGNNCIRK